MNVRQIALDLLGGWQANDGYINLTVKRASESLQNPDRAYLTALLFGTVEHLISLDYYIGKTAKRSDFDPFTKDILRLAFYELYFMKTAKYATVNEWTSIARNKSEKSFVNGVLRGALRNEDTLQPPPKEKNLLRHLMVVYSLPLDTLRFLQKILENELEDFLKASSTPSNTTLRINTCKISRDDYAALLLKENISFEFTKYSLFGIVLKTPAQIPSLPGFDEGFFFVQDEASQLHTMALDPKEEDTILDVCACPGGKSFGAAIEMNGNGKIIACDVHASKLPLILNGAKRLSLSCIETKEQDGTEKNEEFVKSFHRVICDVPCSGLGVISKKPDLRYKDLSSLSDLISLQKNILKNAANYVVPGGILLYSTCTINPDENENVVEAFLEENPEFSLVSLNLPSIQTERYLTLYPHIHHMDGFFIAKMQRRR